MITGSTAPRHVQARYLRGGCFVLAIELHRVTGLPLWGLKLGSGPEAELHHAFIADPDRDLAIDIRGSRPIGRMREGSRDEHQLVAVPISEAEIMAVVGSFGAEEIKEARRAVRDHLREHVLDIRKAREMGGPGPS